MSSRLDKPCTLLPGLFPRILQATESLVGPGTEASMCLYMSMFANNALLGGGVRVRVWIREQRKIKRSKAPLSQSWMSLTYTVTSTVHMMYL